VLVATEAVKADHARRPRPERALLDDSPEGDRRRHSAQPLEVEGAGDAYKRRGLAGNEAVGAELRRRKRRERGADGRQTEPSVLGCGEAEEACLDAAGFPGGDQLAAERLQERVGDGCRSKRPESLETPCRRADERITGEAAQELGVVGFCGEDEAKRLERALGLAALEPHSQEPFARLPDASERRPAAVSKTAVRTPSSKTRVRSPARRAESPSEYGPRGLSVVSSATGRH
jgi:hypothetical protein